MLAGMMRKLLHRRRRAVVMQRRQETQSTLGRGGTCRRVEIVFPCSQKELARRVTRMMAHVMPHVRWAHVGGRVRMMRRIALMMEVVMLLRRRLDSRGRLNTGNDVG